MVFIQGRCASCIHVYMHAAMLCRCHSLISTQTFHRALVASVDSCTETNSTLRVAQPVLAGFRGRCQKAMLGVCI